MKLIISIRRAEYADARGLYVDTGGVLFVAAILVLLCRQLPQNISNLLRESLLFDILRIRCGDRVQIHVFAISLSLRL